LLTREMEKVRGFKEISGGKDAKITEREGTKQEKKGRAAASEVDWPRRGSSKE